MKEYSSHFKKHITLFVAQKQTSGFPYHSSICVLKRFDRFCMEHYPQEKTLTRTLALHWAQRLQTEHLKTLSNRICVLRQFAKYLIRQGCEAYVMPSEMPGRIPRYVPHIYTQQELSSFFKATDQVIARKVSPARHLVIPVIFRLLYCCGLRSSEATGLKVTDIEWSTGKIVIRQGKGNKDRTVMLSEDLLSLCETYHQKVSFIFSKRLYFFPNHLGKCYGPGFLGLAFHECWKKTGIQVIQGNAPRVHDFRHSFSVSRLNKWVEEGKDLQAYLPYLSAYLGHASLSETDYYLHLVPEFFPWMISKGEERFAHLIPEPIYEA